MASIASEFSLVETDPSDVPQVVAAVREGFASQRTLPIEYRLRQLRKLRNLIEDNKDKILAALDHDLRKGETETTMMETNVVVNEINICLNGLRDWDKPVFVKTDLLNRLNRVYIQRDPHGTVLIFGAWNYPFQLSLMPLVGAIAGGNSCIVKPSELSVATSNLIAELLPKYLDNEVYFVVTGGVSVGQALLKERFNHIFYTGSTNVGRIVMKSAAENLTSVTLELGGKSPCIVLDDANVAVAGRRIVWGKFINAGQTCIAPDYVLVTPGNREKLLKACQDALKEFYGEDPVASKDYGRIVNDRHFQRVSALLDGTSGRVVCGGEKDAASRYVAPTLIDGVTPGDGLMQEEIFGPLLPFITIQDEREAIRFVNEREKPLAFYVFTESRPCFERVMRQTSAGGVTHNDIIMHASIAALPFGGVGHSGCGSYHGKHSYETFTNCKSVLSVGTGLEALNKLRYPPSSPFKLRRLQWLLGVKEQRPAWHSRLLLLFLLAALTAIGVQMFGVPTWLSNLIGR